MSSIPALAAERLLHSSEAARLLGVSPAWLARERWKGSGPTFVRVGGTNGRAVRYRASDLAEWIDRNAVSPRTR